MVGMRMRMAMMIMWINIIMVGMRIRMVMVMVMWSLCCKPQATISARAQFWLPHTERTP